VRRTFEREVSAQTVGSEGDDAHHASVDAAERLSSRLLASLVQWFGRAGTSALASRALSRIQFEHRSLASVRLSSTDVTLVGLDRAAEAHGAAATVAGVLAMLTELAHAMGRLVNDQLAAEIFTRSAAPGPPSAGRDSATTDPD